SRFRVSPARERLRRRRDCLIRVVYRGLHPFADESRFMRRIYTIDSRAGDNIAVVYDERIRPAQLSGDLAQRLLHRCTILRPAEVRERLLFEMRNAESGMRNGSTIHFVMVDLIPYSALRIPYCF